MRTETPPPRAQARALTARQRHALAPTPLAEREPESRYAISKGQPHYYVPHLSPSPVAPLGSPQWHRAIVRHLAEHMPQKQRGIRAKSSLDIAEWENSNYADEHCPGCADTPGWLDFETLEFCPLCLGFQLIPRTVLNWYAEQRRALEANAVSEERRADRGKALEARL